MSQVFNFHQLYSGSGDEVRISGKYGISIENFTSIIDYFANEINSSSNQSGAIILTFDDGFKSHRDFAAPYLLKKNLNALFFPILEQIGQPGYMNWDDLHWLIDHGFQIGSHGKSHHDLTKVDLETLENEITVSKIRLEKELKVQMIDFALPYGKYNERVINQLENAGYKKIYTTQGVSSKPSTVLVHRWNVMENTKIKNLQQWKQRKGIRVFLKMWFFNLKNKV